MTPTRSRSRSNEATTLRSTNTSSTTGASVTWRINSLGRLAASTSASVTWEGLMVLNGASPATICAT